MSDRAIYIQTVEAFYRGLSDQLSQIIKRQPKKTTEVSINFTLSQVFSALQESKEDIIGLYSRQGESTLDPTRPSELRRALLTGMNCIESKLFETLQETSMNSLEREGFKERVVYTIRDRKANILKRLDEVEDV